MAYKKIAYIILIFAMTFSSNSALGALNIGDFEIKTKADVVDGKNYFAHATEVKDGSGEIIGYNFTEPILQVLAKAFVGLNKENKVYGLDTSVVVTNNRAYAPINTGNVNPVTQPVQHDADDGLTAVNPDPLTTSALSPEIPSLNNKLQILSELNKADLSLLTEDYSPEQIEAISNEIDNFYTTALGDVTSPEKAVEISHIATKNDIDLKKYYNPNDVDSSDDAYVNTLAPKEQGELYLATIQDIENRDDKAEGILN